MLVALEQGRSSPNLATLARIGDAFGVPVTRLVDMSGEPSVQISGPGGRVLWHGPSGGTGTILGATGSAVGGGTVTVDADAGGDIRRRCACPGDPGDGLGRERRAHTCRSRASGTSSPPVSVPGSRPGARYANEGPDPVQLTMVVVVPPTEA